MAAGSAGDRGPAPRPEPEVPATSPFAPPPAASAPGEIPVVAIGPATGPSSSPLIDPIANSPFAPPKGTHVDTGEVVIGPPTEPTSSALIRSTAAGVPWVAPAAEPTIAPAALPWSPAPGGDPDAGPAKATGDLPEPLDWFSTDDRPEPVAPATVVESRPPWRRVGAILATLGLVAASTFTFLSVVLTDGAPTPEDAVHRLFDAIDREDAIGVLESLPPSERAAIKQPLTELVGELQRLGLLQPFALGSVPGTDLRIEDLSLRAEPVGDSPDLMAVRVTSGHLTGRAVPDAVPLGESLRRVLAGDSSEPFAIPSEPFSADLAAAPLRLITVKEKRGWHVSLLGTVAEALRGDRSAAPTLGGGPDPVGASSPDGAVRELAAAAAALDPARALTVLAPDELRGVYDAAPLFLPVLNRAIAAGRGDELEVELGSFETRSEGDGDQRKVFVTALDLSFGNRWSTYHLTFDGSCAHLDERHRRTRNRWYPTTSDECLRPRGSTTPGTSPGSTGDATTQPATAGTLDRLGVLGGLSADTGVTVVQRDGRWYVSPMRTLLDTLISSLRQTGRDDVEQWGREWAALLDGSAWAVPAPPPRGPSFTPTSVGGSGSFGGAAASSFPAECAQASPLETPVGASTHRVAFLYEEAARLCFNGAGYEYPPPDGCYATYLVLSMRPDVDEQRWQEADGIVAACMAQRFEQGALPDGGG